MVNGISATNDDCPTVLVLLISQSHHCDLLFDMDEVTVLSIGTTRGKFKKKEKGKKERNYAI